MTDYRTDKKLSPVKAAYAHCKACMGADEAPRTAIERIRNCTSPSCPMFKHRLGGGAGRLKIADIKNHCLHCTGWPVAPDGTLIPDPPEGVSAEAKNEAKSCTGYSCPFWPYRPGTKPYRGAYKGSSKEQLDKIRPDNPKNIP